MHKKAVFSVYKKAVMHRKVPISVHKSFDLGAQRRRLTHEQSDMDSKAGFQVHIPRDVLQNVEVAVHV
jgi:hypothetical protein